MATDTMEMDQNTLPEVEVTTSVVDRGNWAKTLKITVAADQVGKVFDKVAKEWAGKAQLPGFRPGRVPPRVVERRFEREIQGQVKSEVVQASLQAAMKKEGLDPVGEPDLHLVGIEATRNKEIAFEVDLEVRPQFELGNYRGLPVEQEEVELFPEEIEGHLKELANRLTPRTDAGPDAVLGVGDVATATVKYRVGSEVLHTEEAAQILLVEGKIYGLEAELESKFLEGAKPGEVRTGQGKVREGTKVEALKGKEVTLEIALKGIQRQPVVEMTDELAQKAGAKSLEDLKSKIGEELRGALVKRNETRIRKELTQRLAANSPFDLPKRLFDKFVEAKKSDGRRMLAHYGLDGSELPEYEERLISSAQEGAETDLRSYFILDAIRKKEQLTVSDEDVDDEVFKIAKARKVKPSELFQQLEESGGLLEIRHQLEDKKTMDFVVSQAEITVVPRKKGEPKPEDGHEGCADCESGLPHEHHHHDHAHEHGHAHDHEHGHAHGDAPGQPEKKD